MISEQLAKMPPRLGRWSRELYAISTCFPTLDILFIAAICDRESSGNHLALSPDGGHGLMQIDGRFHASFIAAVGPDGRPLWTYPLENLLFGTRLFLDNLKAASAHGRTATDALACAIAGYNADLARVLAHAGVLTGEPLIIAIDAITTGGDYVADVFHRRDLFAALMGEASGQ